MVIPQQISISNGLWQEDATSHPTTQNGIALIVHTNGKQYLLNLLSKYPDANGSPMLQNE